LTSDLKLNKPILEHGVLEQSFSDGPSPNLERFGGVPYYYRPI